MSINSPGSQQRESAGQATVRSHVNVPNAFCAIRLAGSLGLIALAIMNRPTLFLIVFSLLIFTDWIDGRFANWLQQRSTFGARFDSVADAAMYGGLLFGCVWFKADALAHERVWMVAALGTFLFSCSVALIKFRRLPSHHTYSAKLAAVVTVIAAIALLTDWSIWPLRAATIAVAYANLESALITLLSDQWRADVPTIWHALRDR
ncbi:MAG: CDP-alcohol phosphatidyltransferase family protein [Pirellulales bacterium]